jgi:UDP-N-acetylglucosamine--N-acetylmuramyl-(pentapeptide) pyrophosphoryl-undecaprenol N-acetylglucosamine transferase
VVIAGGATGGHLMPGLAIADALVRRGYATTDIHFVGSARGIDREVVPPAGYALTALPGRGIERRLTVRNVANAAAIAAGLTQGVMAVGRLRPQAVVVLGGYASVPGLAGALVHRVPMVATEQNAVPSLATRWADRFARATAVPVAQGLRHEVVTGNPVRAAVAALAGADARPHRLARGFPLDRHLVLAFGGSLGSRRINEAVLGLARAWSHRTDLAVVHVAGRRDWEDVRARRPVVSDPGLWYLPLAFDDDLPSALAAADVVVCRAGASTVAELAVIGRPAVLVPGPWAPNDAQTANAAVLAGAGAAVVIRDSDLDAGVLRSRLEQLLGDGRLSERAGAAAALGRPGAADAVAALVVEHSRG